MSLEHPSNERQIIQHALEWYLSELREEIAKTEKYDMRMKLHGEEDVLNRYIVQLKSPEQVCISPH
ncbi:MAG: hypothetical protein ACM3KE_11575 [Hyphomicrobiales bacterium]